MCVAVVEDRGVPADREEGAQVVPLAMALSHSWRSDAHFQQGFAIGHARRFVKGEAVTLTCIAFDFDAPGHAMTAEWEAEAKAKIGAALEAHPSGFGYLTKNGARLLWAVEPVTIDTPEAARVWSRRYLTTIAYLCRRFGLEADASCHEPSRLFRLPRVVREGVATAPLTIGSPSAIGVLDVRPDAADEAAAALSFPRLFEAPSRPTGGTLAASKPVCPMGDADASRGGLLHALLSARGHVVAPDGGETAGYRIRCPRSSLHSSGDGEAVLYAPSGSGPGAIHCFHSSCVGLEPDDWLREFSEAERAAVGILEGVIVSVWIDAHERRGVRLVLNLREQPGALPIPYVRVAAGTAAWSALWRAADVEAPSDTDVSGDLGEAVHELKGRRIAGTFNGTNTTRIMPGLEVKKPAVAA